MKSHGASLAKERRDTVKRAIASMLSAAVLLWTSVSGSAAFDPGAYRASLQRYASEFISTMYTYSVPDSVENFAEAERYMLTETASRWREWYSEWLRKAGGFSSVSSSVSVNAVFVDPRPGKNGEVYIRAEASTFSRVLGRNYETNSTFRIVLLPYAGGGYGVAYVKQSSEGGFFELSVAGVKTESSPERFETALRDSGLAGNR